jgi:hypothetical protein
MSKVLFSAACKEFCNKLFSIGVAKYLWTYLTHRCGGSCVWSLGQLENFTSKGITVVVVLVVEVCGGRDPMVSWETRVRGGIKFPLKNLLRIP